MRQPNEWSLMDTELCESNTSSNVLLFNRGEEHQSKKITSDILLFYCQSCIFTFVPTENRRVNRVWAKEKHDFTCCHAAQWALQFFWNPSYFYLWDLKKKPKNQNTFADCEFRLKRQRCCTQYSSGVAHYRILVRKTKQENFIWRRKNDKYMFVFCQKSSLHKIK